jgi:DNA-binding MarR family transcriptional regulator
MSANKVFNASEKVKLQQIINEGMNVMSEIEVLNEGLKDTIKNIAEEMDIKPAVLKKAIKIAHKAGFTRESENHELLETILVTVGKTI